MEPDILILVSGKVKRRPSPVCSHMYVLDMMCLHGVYHYYYSNNLDIESIDVLADEFTGGMYVCMYHNITHDQLHRRTQG